MRHFFGKKTGYLLAWLLLACSVGVVWLLQSQQALNREPPLHSPASPTFTPSPVPQPTSKNTQMAGVWVPYMSLSGGSQEEFEANFKGIADSAKEKGLTALFVHVRPFCDALYPSKQYPWSHLLTGKQGQDPGYDPLKFMVEYTHGLGLEFHAWINPLRVRTAETPGELAQDNPYTVLGEEYPFYFMEWEGGVYLNPAYPYIRSLIADGAAEIVENYPVDGIHFDDYFYPAQDAGLDEEAYQLHVETVQTPLELEEWRSANINAMMALVYEKVKAVREDVAFGVSPQGNIANDHEMGADVEAWCATSGYADYVCPQIYYSFENEGLDYTQALEEWSKLYRHPNARLYVGLALYKAGAGEEDWAGGQVIGQQITAAREAACNGIILYSSAYLDTEQTQEEVRNAVEVLAKPKGGG
ncbi:MAG: family 10 glycosylhydrolase [Acutalibacter sp.]|nr:family 10 glycosylhydrolase [Acutalibacter sp.]